ncbi:MAG: glycosyltransferase [Azoarcus sp.]|jgi:glycosyltransferase involved in cell wall biosynthesis|nr:glycosyltransferase [Azoarcus sp.]
MNQLEAPVRVSVVIPVFNRRDMVAEAVDSALAQTSAALELEVIVVDDRSTDDTVATLIVRYGHDVRVRIMGNTRAKGPAGARNTGILAARFPFVAFLDSDDFYLPGHLAAAVAVFARYPHVGLVFGRMRCEQNGIDVPHLVPKFEENIRRAPRTQEDESTIVFGPDFFAHLLEAGCYFGLCSVLMRAEAARELMSETLSSTEDYEFWARTARKRVFACLKAPQVCVRRHASNLSSDSAGQVELNHLRACRMMLAYPGLRANERRLIGARMAKASFDLAWRYKQNGCPIKSIGMNLQSMRYGLIWKNVLALAKLPVSLFLRRRESMRHGQNFSA